jgi:hypothetical protein
MSARDKVHQQVVNALKKDGWTITNDPVMVPWRTRRLQVDLGAEKLIAAQKDAELIAVEIKSFSGTNDLVDLYHALGQFVLYRKALQKADPQRTLFLAIDEEAFVQNFDDAEGETLRADEDIKLLVFNKQTEEIIQWKR